MEVPTLTKRKILALLIAISMLLLSSCSKEEIPYEDVLAEFSQYEKSNDTVLFLDPYVYFTDYRINLEDFFS